jgi:hypothetical protein
MRRPKGITDDQMPAIMRLRKCIYGLPQASRYFNDHLSATLLSNGFKRLISDPQIYIKVIDDKKIICSTHVDDLLCAATRNTTLLQDMSTQLSTVYDISITMDPTNHLGLVITRNRSTFSLTLTQPSYVAEILQKFKPKKVNIYKTNFNKFNSLNSENYDSSPSRSTSSMSSDSSDSSEYGNRRRIGKRIQPVHNSKMGEKFSPFERVEELDRKVYIPEMDPIMYNDVKAKKIYYKLGHYLKDENLPKNMASIDFTEDEINKIQEYGDLSFMFTSLANKLKLINQVHAFSEGGKFKKSKRRYKSNKSRKGGKYRKTRKGGKSKNKKTRKH